MGLFCPTTIISNCRRSFINLITLLRMDILTVIQPGVMSSEVEVFEVKGLTTRIDGWTVSTHVVNFCVCESNGLYFHEILCPLPCVQVIVRN